MKYSDVRLQICTGDLIAIRKKTGALPTLTRVIDKTPYTHTAVAIWGGFQGTDRLLVVESNAAGASLSPLSNYQDVDFDVFARPVDEALFEFATWDLLGTKIHYDIRDLVRLAANRLFSIPLPKRDDGNLICSALSATIYLHAGWNPKGLPSIPSPRDVVEALRAAPVFEVLSD